MPTVHLQASKNLVTDLTPNQSVAYDLLLPFLQGAHGAHLAVLEGYAGTGKTFLVARLLAGMPGMRIAVAAPTNKAVRVLRDQLQAAGLAVAGDNDGWGSVVCRSIHSLLGLKLKELDNGKQEAVSGRGATLRDYDVVVIDECSMIDDALFRMIVTHRGGARVLFVGDPAQLPPVGDGASLSPVFGRVDFQVRLSAVIRQAVDNPIIKMSIRLRQLIESGIRATPMALMQTLPALADAPKVALVSGSSKTLVDFYLSQHEDDPKSDTRIIAYTNRQVQHYNRLVHHALHGATATRFVAGETVIVQAPCEVLTDDGPFPKPARLITSEELIVVATNTDVHPLYPAIAAERVRLRGANGAHYRAWIPVSVEDWQKKITDCFDEYFFAKSRGRHQDAKEASDRGWALKNGFAELRHAYAITAHKSQGSTFDCALVDFTDLAKMPDAAQFNRALYVAVTRSREFLALVVA